MSELFKNKEENPEKGKFFSFHKNLGRPETVFLIGSTKLFIV